MVSDSESMPSRKPNPKPDDNTKIVDAVNTITDSDPVRGEDLLPPRLAKKLREAKKRLQKSPAGH